MSKPGSGGEGGDGGGGQQQGTTGSTVASTMASGGATSATTTSDGAGAATATTATAAGAITATTTAAARATTSKTADAAAQVPLVRKKRQSGISAPPPVSADFQTAAVFLKKYMELSEVDRKAIGHRFNNFLKLKNSNL